MRLDPRAVGEYWGSGGLSVFARLREAVQPEAAGSELRAWIPRIRAMFPWRMPDAWGRGAQLAELRAHLVADAKVRSLLLLGVVALVLLIAIVNVANLMIGQTAARQRELALRASLGATAGRLARQLLTEAVVLALTGGALGTLLAFGQLTMLKHWLPADTPRLAGVTIDQRILAFTAAISLGSGLLFGLLPAWRSRAPQSLTMIEEDHPRHCEQTPYRMTEAAWAAILLVGGGPAAQLVDHAASRPRVESIVTAELSPGRRGRVIGEDRCRVRAGMRALLYE